VRQLPSENSGAGRLLLWAIGALVLVRLVSLACYPLMDQTEARYADIARRMVGTGDWVTPWFADGVPFWGKPPLSFWATALGFKLFGINELAARLPHLVLGAAVAGLVWQHARQASQRAAWHGVAILSGSALFLVSSGAVMTDMALTLGTTLVMVGFWRALHAETDDPGAAWQMVLGASIGLLAKGPVSLILWGVPVLVWVALTGRLLDAWRRVAWLRGAALALALSIPWYLWAEARTPGFLRYFIIGEHWHRFVTPGWTGDLYGSAHQFTRGTIWLFALGAAMPWPLLLALAWLFARRQAPGPGVAAGDGEAGYLWAWALTPCLFFTAAGNILWTYVLPGLPALAILAGHWTSTRARQARAEGMLTLGIVICTVVIVALLVLAPASGLTDRKSAKSLVSDYQAHQARALPEQSLYFLGRVPFSGSFYSHGKARALADIGGWPVGQPAFLILDEAVFEALSPKLRERVTPVSIRGGRVLARMQ
jgi:4-amino-4-deoxy-L-arabinose transferase-like glycosyltransferase